MTGQENALSGRETDRNYKVQILRALAIFAVVLIHTCPSGKWQVFFRPFINYAVALFFFLSGYLTKLDNKNWLTFYRKRVIRVLIPYFVWTILYTLANNTPNLILINLLTTKATATLYYIFAYIQFVILTPVLGKLAKSKYRWAGWLVSPISTIFFKYVFLFTGLQLNEYVSLMWDVCCLGWFTYYYLGLLLGNGLLNINYNIKNLVLFYALSILLQMAEGYIWLFFGESNCGTQVKLSAFLTSTLFLLIAYYYLTNENIIAKNRFVILLGDRSLGIYLSHSMVMRVLYHIPYYSMLPYIINSIVVLLTSLACVIIGRKICGEKVSRWLGLI